LKVMKFIELSAASTCPSNAQPATLEDTTWSLVELNGKAIEQPKEGQGAHFVLMSKDKRVAGSGGCNRVFGGYTLDGDKLTFSKMASTMMMCEDTMELEQRFLKMLDTVAHWSIAGDMLVLKNIKNEVVAKLGAQSKT